MAANTTPSTQDVRSFLHLINIQYKVNLDQRTIDNTAQEIHAQGILTVNEFLQPHIIQCLGIFVPPTVATAVTTYFNAMTKSQAPKLPPLTSVPPLPAPKVALKPPPGLAPPPGLKSPAPQQPQQPQQPAQSQGAQKQSQSNPPQQQANAKAQLSQQQQLLQSAAKSSTTTATTTTSSTSQGALTTTPTTKLVFSPTSKLKAVSDKSLYLPGKYQRKTTCRFCPESVVIGVNDYSTLLTRTTKIYTLLVEQADRHANSRQVTMDGAPHRQPQIPYILDSAHPLPLPLPSHLTDVCDGGKIIAMELKLNAIISSLLAKSKGPKRDKMTFIDKDTGMVDLEVFAQFLSSASVPTAHLLDLFEDPPYDLTPLPQPDFIQGSATGEDPSGLNNIPACLRRMVNTCTRLLPCGCPCNGLRGELATDCPPCSYHELTEEQHDACGVECLICADDLLKQGPTFISGSYQHIMARPGLRKQPDLAFPVQDYLISLGLNGHFVDFSHHPKSSSITSQTPPFEIDNYHPNNFLNLDSSGALSSALADYQPAGGHQLVAKQTWSHNSLPPALAFLNENNVCKHAHHLDCFMQRLNTNWETGKRINFNYLRCHMCTLYIFHPILVPHLVQHYALEQYVTAKAIQRLEYDGELKNDEIMLPESEFYDDPVGYALKQYVFYLCSTCQKPYFGGTADCQMDNGEGSNGQLVCLTCCPTPGKTCEHAEEFMVHKCKFCCKHSTYICWSNTWFCDGCHVPSIWPTLVYSRSGKNKLNIEQYLQCPSLERQIKALQASAEYQNSKSSQLEQLQRLRCDPKECPLRVAHPPNGFNFVIGCKQCETEGLTEGITYEDSSDDEATSTHAPVVKLQGIKQKRVKVGRKKGPRMRAVAKGPSPYIVPFFELESHTFNQLSLYSYLYLYRVLYDKHFLLPQAAVYDSYLRYNYQRLSLASPLLKDMFDASQAMDKVQFVDLIPFTPIRDDNFLKLPSSSLLSTAAQSSSPTSLTPALLSPTPSAAGSSGPGSGTSNTQEFFHQTHNIPNTDTIKSNQRISFQFSPSYLLDHNGFFYFLGTLGHTQPYLNPHKRGLVQCSSSADQADFSTLPPWGLLERTDVRHVSENKFGVSYTVDLKLVRMAPTHYSLKHYTTRADGCIRSWVMEGFSNGSWYSLDVRDRDFSINGRDSAAIFQCNQISDFGSAGSYAKSPMAGGNNVSNRGFAPKRYFTQFRLRQTEINSLQKDFLAVTGFELYGEVEFPTIQELLLPATKHYSDSASKWSQKVQREALPETTTALTSTPLLPNVIRFVLDNGVRFLNLSPAIAATTQTLFQEEALRQYKHYAQDSSTTKDAKIRTFTISSTNFLPIQLPPNIPSPLKQTFIMTRNFTHNQYHNNRLDLGWCVSYNEPLLLSMIATLNSLFSSSTPTPLNLAKTPDATAEQTYIANITARGNWQLLSQFGGAIIPSLKFIQDVYNLPAVQFQQFFNDVIVSQLQSTSQLDKAEKAEELHQKNRQKEDDLRVAQAKLAEEDAARQRKMMREEEQRVAKLQDQAKAQTPMTHASVSPSSSVPAIDGGLGGASANASASASANTNSNTSGSSKGSANSKSPASSVGAAVAPAERSPQQPATPTTATNSASGQLSRTSPPFAPPSLPSSEEFSPTQLEDIAMVRAGLSSSVHNPLLLYKTPSLESYSQFLTQFAKTPVAMMQNFMTSGGIFYYLGTLNHTDITNLSQIQQEIGNNASGQGKKAEKTDAALRPVFKFTNPQQLGAVALTASSYPYQLLPLYNLVDSLIKFKTDQAINPERIITVDPAQIPFNPASVPLSSHSPFIPSLSSAWIQFDFGCYRVSLNGYSLNFGGVRNFPTDWILEGSNGPAVPTSTDLALDPSLATELTFAWPWTPLVTHVNDSNHLFLTNGLYNVGFAQPQDESVVVSPPFLKHLHQSTAAAAAAQNSQTSPTSPTPDDQFTFRYIRLRSLTPNQPLHLSGIEFFGSVLTTVPFPLPAALEVEPGLDLPRPPTATKPDLGGKSQNDLLRHGRKTVICNLANRRFLQHHAYLSLMFKSGLFRHTRAFIEANGGPSNGAGFTNENVLQYLQHYDLATLKTQFAVEEIQLLNGLKSNMTAMLPGHFSTLFDYFRFAPTHEHFSCYSSGLPGLHVTTFKQGQPDAEFVFRNGLNPLALEAHYHYFNRHNRPTNTFNGYDLSAGNLLFQQQAICNHFRNSIDPVAFSPQDIESITASTISAPFPTAGYSSRFTTAVYASSTDSKPFLLTDKSIQLIPSPQGGDVPTQFTLPSLLTTSVSSPQNNLAWASSPIATSPNPYIIVDLGPFQRLQLVGYSLGLYASPDKAKYPRNFQVFGSINASDWYIISNHPNDELLSAQNPVATWGAAPQIIGAKSDPLLGVVDIPVQNTMTPYGVPLYFPAYRFFCFISTGVNSGGKDNQLMLSKIDFTGTLVSSSVPLSTLPFPYDPFRYPACRPPRPL